MCACRLLNERTTTFTYSHDNSIRAVAERVVDGAAVDSLVYDYPIAREPAFSARTRVIAKSPPYGIPPVVVHPAIDPALREALRELAARLTGRAA